MADTSQSTMRWLAGQWISNEEMLAALRERTRMRMYSWRRRAEEMRSYGW